VGDVGTHQRRLGERAAMRTRAGFFKKKPATMSDARVRRLMEEHAKSWKVGLVVRAP
jgi:hypothetical protein